VIKSNVNFFLDTTIQIDRQLAKLLSKKRLEEILKQAKKLLTSTYVKMEYKRSLVQDWVYIFNMLGDVENIGEVLLRIKGLSPKANRKINRTIGSLAWFFLDGAKEISELQGKDLIEKVRHYFRPLIEFSVEDFDNSVDFVLNETDCFNAKHSPMLKREKFDNRTAHCKLSDLRCRIVEFFNQNLNEFKEIYKMLSSLPQLDEEQRRMRNVLEKALKYPHNMANYKNCWRCADSIIAVECPYDGVLFTTNKKHFEPICNKIGKKLAIVKY